MLGGPMFDWGIWPFLPRQVPREVYPDSDYRRDNQRELYYAATMMGSAVHSIPVRSAYPVTINGADLVHVPTRAATASEVTRNILAGQPGRQVYRD